MATKKLNELLKQLDLYNNQTVYFADKADGKTFTFPSKETEKKLNIIKPTAFYVFNEQPYILFFDISENDTIREAEIHKQVWSFDQSPLIFIIRGNDIEIFNAFAYDKSENRLEKIELKEGENINQLFSFWNLQSGSIWTWLQENHYRKTIQDKRVNQKLFDNIKFVRETLTDKTNNNSLGEEEANILILRLIFIRYLIDRNVNLDANFINGKTIIERKKSFIELIETPRKLNTFFEQLNDKFNGVLFKGVKIQLSKEKAKALSQIFNGEKPEDGTLFGAEFYFEIFDFSIIPVEVISGIYEALINEETRKLHSAVYTPSFLVEYILTNTIDVFFEKKGKKSKTECKIFDPSVGSGIFLVQAFRRMVDKEIELCKEKKISKVRLREIAQNNLFGIDINLQALKVTCFSIYIAILDYQDPKTILDNFHFPILINENLFNSNFFNTTDSYNEIIKSKQLDFILGNPPWKKDKTIEHLNWVNSTKTYNKKIKGELEIAQSFLLRSKEFMQPQTVSALIVTSTIFYNVSTTTKEFKTHFLKDFCITNFFDLSAVKQSLFEQQESPASIVSYVLSKNENYLTNTVKHQSLKANLFLKYYKTLVIEKFDQKEIQQKHFIENDWMFKVALYGNTLDYIFLKNLENIEQQICDVIDDRMVFKGAGIERGKDNKPFDGLINMPIIENSEIKEYFTQVDINKVLKKEDINLSRGRKIEIFKGSKIILKEQSKDWNKPVISYSNVDCVFRKGSFAIASTDDQIIKTLYSYLISDLYLYFLFNVTCAWGIGTRPAIRFDEEYLSFPLKQINEETNEKLIKLVTSFLKPFQEHYKHFHLGEPQKNKTALYEINKIIENIYKITDCEKDLIDYVLDISRYQFQESKLPKIIRKVNNDKDVLEKYVHVFLIEFKDIYENIQAVIYPLEHFIAINFIITKAKPNKMMIICNDISDEKEVFKSIANNLSVSEIAKDLYIQKDIKGFEENSFYIIKPNEYKCWHKAMAWYDIAEIKETIQALELERLKSNFNGIN